MEAAIEDSVEAIQPEEIIEEKAVTWKDLVSQQEHVFAN